MKPGRKNLLFWSRKFHIHLGLFLLLFIWLYSASGLLLNHGNKWRFASFWEQRREKTFRMMLPGLSGVDSTDLLQKITGRFQIQGEVNRVELGDDSIHFKISRPGTEWDIGANLRNGNCVIKEMSFNGWGILRILHTFNGVDKSNPNNRPHWILSRIWLFSKDITATGLILICLTSWFMWFSTPKKDITGVISFLSGIVISVLTIFL